MFKLSLLNIKKYSINVVGKHTLPLIDKIGTSNTGENVLWQQRRVDEVADVVEIEDALFMNKSTENAEKIDTEKLLKSFKKPMRRDDPSKIDASTENRFSSRPIKSVRKNTSRIINDEASGLTFTRLQLGDPEMQNFLLTVKSKKLRYKKHQLLMEGRRLIKDSIKCGLPLTHLLFSDFEQVLLLKDDLEETTKLYKVPHSDLKLWTNLTTCPGIMGIFNKPLDMSTIWSKNSMQRLPITVICDQIREPNNLGSIIRNAAALPCEEVIITKGCADPWESKALRGAAGAQLLIPVKGPMDWNSISSILPANSSLFIAENNADNCTDFVNENLILNYSNVSYADHQHCALVIGGETQGVSDEAYSVMKQFNGKCVHIPLAPGIDSLNTSSALAVLLFEMKKQILSKLEKN